MPSCIVKGCSFRWRKKDPDVALHVFPRDMETIKAWLSHINQDFGDLEEFCHKVFNSSKGTYRICSQHFTPDAYEIRGMVTFLKKDAVPTLFPLEEMEFPTRKRRKKQRHASPAEAGASASANLPFTSTAFFMPEDLEMPWTTGDSLKTNQSAPHFVHSPFHPGQPPQEASPYTYKHSKPHSTRTIGTTADDVPGQVHRSTQLDKPMGTEDKNLQTDLGPPCRSVGIQCNLDNLPCLLSRSAVPSIGTSRTFAYRNWRKFLHSQFPPYFQDYWE